MLRTQVFDGLLGGAFEIGRSHQKFLLRGNVNSKGLAVADHIENVAGDHWRLPDHANLRGLLRQDEPGDLVILLDHSAIGGSGGGQQVHRSVQGIYPVGLVIVLIHQGLLGGVQRRVNLGGWHGMFRAHSGGRAARDQKRDAHQAERTGWHRALFQNISPIRSNW